MSCQHCSPENTLVSFTNINGANYLISAFAAEGAAVSFGATDQSGLDIKYDTDGNYLTAGSRVKKMSITIRTTCAGAEVLWNDYKVKNFQDCGQMEITDNCCADESYGSARIVSIKRPGIGDTVDYFEIELEGVLQ